MWMLAAGIASDEPLRALHFSQTSLAVQAAARATEANITAGAVVD